MAELLSELGSTNRANLYALTTSNTLLGLNVSTICGCGHVRGVEELGSTKCITYTRSTVTDCNDLALTINIGDLVNISMTLSTCKDFINLFLGDVMTDSTIVHVLSHVAHTDAVVATDLTGAFATDCLLLTAGALRDTVLVIHIDPTGQMFYISRLVL